MTPKNTDWKIAPNGQSVHHKSGLSVRLENGRKTALDIQGISRLAGTEWAQRIHALVEQGIFLLEEAA
jgi:hypothetical protein